MAQKQKPELTWIGKDQQPNLEPRILVFSLDPSWVPKRLPRTEEANSIYSNPDNDPRGSWLPGDPYANKPCSKGRYTITGPTGRKFSPPPGRFWRVNRDRLGELDKDGRIWWGSDGERATKHQEIP